MHTLRKWSNVRDNKGKKSYEEMIQPYRRLVLDLGNENDLTLFEIKRATEEQKVENMKIEVGK